MLDAGGGMQRVGSLVRRINQRSGATVGRAGKTSWVTWMGTNSRRLVHGLERSYPTVLRKVVIKAAEARAQHRFSGFAQRVGDAQPRRERQPVIVGCSPILEEGNLQRAQRQERGVIQLGLAGRGEESEAGVVAKAVVDSEAGCHAPGILCIESQPLHVLREAAVARGRTGARCSRRNLNGGRGS